ncbi:MAG TPA: polyprenyl synthetase family protein [Longimicrobium sp.]|nr:polyprenyl synthetase family protein [Longimicrobium sp.]
MMPITEMEDERRLMADVAQRVAARRTAAFAAARLPLLEAELAGAVDGLGAELGVVQAALARAVGTEGRAGRRWRPLLTFAAAEACGAPPAAAAPAAAAVELTHTASLVLDDLPCMDDGESRRGNAATHRLVGPAGAILVAVGLLGRAAELLARSPRGAAELGAEWGHCIGLRGMSGGQAVDLAGWHGGPARRLLRAKTTALSALALSAGARVAGASPSSAAALAAYGRGLGWAYQLADDAADAAEDAAAGKRPGGRVPLRQGARLMRAAERTLRACGELDRAGVELLVAFGRTVVATPAVPA